MDHRLSIQHSLFSKKKNLEKNLLNPVVANYDLVEPKLDALKVKRKKLPF
jgi:hypothetical protein